MQEIRRERKIEQRWTKLLGARFTPVSDVFLQHYSKLEPAIKPIEAMFIIHLLSFKWDHNDPFPSFGRISDYMGVSAAAVRSYARSLETKGYLKRRAVLGRTSRFDLKPLFSALEAHFLRVLQQRKKEIEEKGDSEGTGNELKEFILDAMSKMGLKSVDTSTVFPDSQSVVKEAPSISPTEDKNK